ncbi:hypothetical protein ACHQM5_000011 [Ranunculus cassubicifolius]
MMVSRQRVNNNDNVSDDDSLAVSSQMLIEASLSGDVDSVVQLLNCSSDEQIYVDYIGTVTLTVRCITDEEEEEEIQLRQFVTDVTPLFAASHSGHIQIAKKLLSAGANVNQELFRGYATTAAARQGHCELLDMLLKAGASQLACEDALLEACLCGQVQAAKLLICSETMGPHVAAHALVSASCKGYVDVVSTLIENGVDINCMDRVLLRSAKPMLHANVNCTPLVGAIVSRQVVVVKYLLETGAKMSCNVRLGAWSWDIFSGEELRVGACLGEPYNEVWCAVEYYEATGQILTLLIQHETSSLSDTHHGRTLLCHAILCKNADAVSVLLNSGADIEFPIRTKKGHESRPLHLAARLGCLAVLKTLIRHGCEVDARTEIDETALMLSAKADQADCFLELVVAGADLGLLSKSGNSAIQLAKRSMFESSIPDIFRQAIASGTKLCSTNLEVFSPLHYVVSIGDIELLQMILGQSMEDIDKHDGSGCTPVVVAIKSGQPEAFRILIMFGADISVKNNNTRDEEETLVSVLQLEAYASGRDRFEEILLDYVLVNALKGSWIFRALHCSAQRGNLAAMVQLLKMGFRVDTIDENGYSPLMLSAREGHSDACKLLLQKGADCKLVNSRGETALSLSRRRNKCKVAEGVIFDHLATCHVLAGGDLYKHTREGKGSPHVKSVRLLKSSGLLSWGRSKRKNVVCKEAFAGPSDKFVKNQGDKSEKRGLVFRVVTETGRDVHFEAASAAELQLWVQGVNLVSKENKTLT